MAEEIARKLRDIQVWLTDHEARLDAHASAIEDHMTRIITLEETVAGLLIPRRLPRRSSTYEYKIYAEPVVGTPLTVQVKAETSTEAIKKAERMFNTQLVKTEILSKHASKKPSNPQRYWVVIYRTPIELRWRREYYPTREEARRRKELLTRFDYEARYYPAGFSSPNPTKLKCRLCGKILPTRSVKEYMEHLELEHAILYLIWLKDTFMNLWRIPPVGFLKCILWMC